MTVESTVPIFDTKRRSLVAPFEIKQESVNPEARTFSGYASTWDVDLDGDRIQPGAFAKFLHDWRGAKTRRRVPLLDQHNYRSALDVTLGKMEDAVEDERGLDTTFSIVPTTKGDDLIKFIEAGYLDSLSIGFEPMNTAEEEVEIDGKSRKVRVIKEIRLVEVSIVQFPANPNARIDASSLKALFRMAQGRELTDQDRAEFQALQKELDDLLKPVVPPAAALEPDAPARVAVDELLRGIRLRQLA